MNDPNGLIFLTDSIMFLSDQSAIMVFGLYALRTCSQQILVHLECCLWHWRSEEYDDYQKGGCFSGSAIEHER